MNTIKKKKKLQESDVNSLSQKKQTVFAFFHTNLCLFDVSLLHRLQGCSGDERVMGRAVSDVLSRQDKQVVMEGQEPAEFWVALGGKAPYASDKR